jgi:predicted transcriptional regulator
METKGAAKILFDQGVKQNEIARILKIAEKTISGWAKVGNWDMKRAEYTLHKETAEEKVWQLINFQLKVISKIRDVHEQTLSTPDLGIKELKSLLIERGDIDALQKLFTTIKGKELEWTQIVKVVRDLTEYIERVNFKLAKEVIAVAQEFINDRRKEL